MRQIRCAFIGLGGASRNLHLPAIRQLPWAQAVGGADPDAGRRAAWTPLGGGPAFERVEQMLAELRPDAVVVATPPDSHADLCVQALEAGAHVLCEKPFVETVEQADAVLAAASRARRSVAVNHQYRHFPIFSSIPPLLGTPGVGRPVFLQFAQLMDLAPWNEPVPWRRAMPHRTLFEGGVHLVDLMHMLLGRPQGVLAARSSGLDRTRVADAIHLVMLDFPDGSLCQITIDRLCRSGTRYIDLRLDCEDASIRASYGGRALLQIGWKRAQRPGVRVELGAEGLAWIERGTARRVIARNPRGVTGRATASLVAETLRSFAAGTEPPSSARIAAETLRIIDAAYESSRTGRRVALEWEAGAPAEPVTKATA